MMKIDAEKIAEVCHEVNRAYCRALGDLSQVAWSEAPEWQRASAVAGVNQILADPGTTPEESHASWMREKIEEGWVYGPVKDPEKKTHPCLVTYDVLPRDQRVKDYLFGAVVRALAPLVG